MNFSLIHKKGLKISIKWKLTFIMTALMMGLIILLTWTHISVQKETMLKTFEKNINVMRDNLISTGKMLLKNLIVNVEKDMAVLNLSGVIESMNTVINANDAVEAMILMDRNRIALFHSKNPLMVDTVMADDISKQAATCEGVQVIEFQQDHIEIISPVQFSTKPWGHLRLILNVKPLIKEIRAFEKQLQDEIYLIKKRTFINACIFMIISFLLVYYLCLRITKKIINLTQSAKLLSQGNFSVQIHQSASNDEISILQNAFKRMASNLQYLIKRLNKYNKELESIVEERTMALKISEEKYKGLYNSSKDGIFYINLDNTFQNANFAFSKLTGYSSQHLKNLKLVNIIDGKDVDKIEEVINKIKQKGFSHEMELNICHRSGELVPVAIHAWLKKDNTGKPDGIWGFGRDISERKLAEKIRADVERTIQHDIKSPLNGIIGLTHLIMEANANNEQSNPQIENIKKLALNSLQLIEYSLNMYKIELGTYQLQAIDCDVISILFELKIESVTLIKAKNLSIDYLFENQVVHDKTKVSCFVRGENLLLKNLFRNLIKNAIEASPENETITINISRIDNEIEVKINNQGMIPENIRLKFFDKYISSGKADGTGLGTYSSKLIAKAHHGDITFQTSSTLGTTLIVYLPASDSVGICDKTTIENENLVFSAIYQQRRNVLIAEDSPNNQMIIGHGIESLTDWQPFFSVNGREAVEIFQNNPIDLVLMDMNMPEYNGAYAIKRIREIEKSNNNKVCIIVISADKTPPIEGADGYVLKYFDEIDQFIQNIVRVMYSNCLVNCMEKDE
jgi:PAS domain S-box-containing protein